MAKKSKSPIDSKIIDLILEHFNTQSFRGNKEVLTGNEFMKLVEYAEALYYEDLVNGQNSGLA
jgi:hypothetical protein|tara:strand:- start:310 stop:498 length:189 start_codon:yes stop_codon:yes gene_type:complete